MNYIEAQKINSALQELTVSDYEFPVTVSLAIVKNQYAFTEALKPYYKLFDDAIRKYSGGNTTISTTDEGYNDFIVYADGLGKQECDVKIKMVNASAIENLTLPIKVINTLSFMIEEV